MKTSRRQFFLTSCLLSVAALLPGCASRRSWWHRLIRPLSARAKELNDRMCYVYDRHYVSGGVCTFEVAEWVLHTPAWKELSATWPDPLKFRDAKIVVIQVPKSLVADVRQLGGLEVQRAKGYGYFMLIVLRRDYAYTINDAGEADMFSAWFSVATTDSFCFGESDANRPNEGAIESMTEARIYWPKPYPETSSTAHWSYIPDPAE